ncbi:MAG: HAD hydrolase-like protein [Anaerolineales bacterium]|nr:HAD hydrolase-like protein [Anaerolineales bacterium]
MAKVIIFDFDGVLADSLELMLRYSVRVCKELGHPCQPSSSDLEALDNMSFDELGRQLGIPDEKIAQYTRQVFDLFTSGDESPGIFDGMDDVIVGLARKYKLGLVTGNSSGVVQDFLGRYGLSKCVDVILCVEDAGTRAEKIKKIIKDMGEPCGEIYFVGDAVSDILSAREASVKSIAVTWGHQSREKLTAAHPDYLVNSPGELMRLLDTC